MKLPSDYKQTIEESVKGQWHFLTKRADIFILPVWLKVGFSSRSQACRNVYGTNISWFIYWHNNEIELYLRVPEFKQAILNVTPKLYSLAGVKQQTNKLLDYCEQAVKRAAFFYERDLHHYSNQKLLKVYEQIIEAYGLSFVNGFFTWCSQVLQKRVRSIVSDYEKKLRKLGLTKDEALGALLNFFETTHYKEKEQALNELGRAFSRRLSNLPKFDARTIERRLPLLNEEIKRFLKAYKWVSFDYNGPVITYEEVVKSILQWQRQNDEKVSKAKIIAACKFSADEIEVFKAMALVSYAKDLRNQTDDYVHYSLDNFFAEVGRRCGLTLAEVKYLWPEELVALLQGRKKYPKSYIRQKREHSMVVSFPDGNATRVYYYVGQEAKDLRESIFSARPAEEKGAPGKREELKGMVASPGKVRGRARIVLTYADVSKVGKGDILVAYMTSPRFMPGIVRCGAIVTNDGGLTCHAAIIARELKKPCIIGTRIATGFLKDGDMVEVDAEAGIVRKLQMD